MEGREQKTILLVEDEALIALSEKKSLERLGYSVTIARSGEDAVEIIEKSSEISLVLMDIDLGEGMDGTAAARSILEKQDLPIVFMSSHREKEIVEKTDAITSYGYIVKTDEAIILDASIKMAFKLFNAREKMEHNYALYRDLVETSQDLIWQCDLEGRYTYLNPAWEQVFGYRLEEMLGRKFSEFQTAGQAEKDILRFSSLLTGDIVSGYETVHLSKTGEDIYLVFNAKSIVGKTGTVMGTRGTAYDVSARKKIESALQKSEFGYRSIIEASPMGMHQYELLEDGRLVFAAGNPEADRILGVDHSLFVGKTIEEAFPPLAATEVPTRYREVAGTGRQWQTEQIDYADDKIRGAFYVVAFQTAQNKMVSTFLDITALKKAEEAKVQSERRYASIFENAVDGILLGSPGGICTDANASMCAILGLAKEDILGKHIRAMPFSAGSLEKKPLRFDLLDKGETVVSNREIARADGSVLAVEMQSVKLPDGSYKAVFRDISDRNRLEGELEENLARFRSIFDHSSVGSVIVGMDKRFIRCNQAFCEFIGYAQSELIGKSIADITYPEDREIGMEALASLVEGTIESARFQKRYRRKDGGTTWGEVSISLVRDGLGKPLYFLPVINDINARMLHEEEILKLLEEKKTLLKETHHRIKNNLCAIESLLGMQCGETRNPEAVAALKDALGRVTSIRLIYDKLLIGDDYRDVSVKKYTESLIDAIVGLFPRSLKISCDRQIGDFDLSSKLLFPLGIIINELLTNIMKYAFAGRESGHIGVSLAKAENMVTLVVKDDGAGLPPGFDLGKATGFGLVLIKMLGEQLGGTVAFEGDHGTRSTLQFEL